MKRAALFATFVLVYATFALVGCSDNPTNAPTQDAVLKSNADREAAIDADPTLTPEGKAMLKERLKQSGSARKE